MNDLIGTYTGQVSLFWVMVTMIVLVLLGFFLGAVTGNHNSYMDGRIAGRAAEREEWNDVNGIINKRVAAMTPADRRSMLNGTFEEPTSDPLGPCPFEPQGEHDWHELKSIGFPPNERHYRCSFCMVAKTEQVLV